MPERDTCLTAWPNVLSFRVDGFGTWETTPLRTDGRFHIRTDVYESQSRGWIQDILCRCGVSRIANGWTLITPPSSDNPPYLPTDISTPRYPHPDRDSLERIWYVRSDGAWDWISPEDGGSDFYILVEHWNRQTLDWRLDIRRWCYCEAVEYPRYPEYDWIRIRPYTLPANSPHLPVAYFHDHVLVSLSTGTSIRMEPVDTDLSRYHRTYAMSGHVWRAMSSDLRALVQQHFRWDVQPNNRVYLAEREPNDLGEIESVALPEGVPPPTPRPDPGFHVTIDSCYHMSYTHASPHVPPAPHDEVLCMVTPGVLALWYEVHDGYWENIVTGDVLRFYLLKRTYESQSDQWKSYVTDRCSITIENPSEFGADTWLVIEPKAGFVFPEPRTFGTRENPCPIHYALRDGRTGYAFPDYRGDYYLFTSDWVRQSGAWRAAINETFTHEALDLSGTVRLSRRAESDAYPLEHELPMTIPYNEWSSHSHSWQVEMSCRFDCRLTSVGQNVSITIRVPDLPISLDEWDRLTPWQRQELRRRHEYMRVSRLTDGVAMVERDERRIRQGEQQRRREQCTFGPSADYVSLDTATSQSFSWIWSSPNTFEFKTQRSLMDPYCWRAPKQTAFPWGDEVLYKDEAPKMYSMPSPWERTKIALDKWYADKAARESVREIRRARIERRRERLERRVNGRNGTRRRGPSSRESAGEEA